MKSPVLLRERTSAEPSPEAEPSAGLAASATLYDARFRNLLGEAAWQRLPPAVQARFSKRIAPGAAILYRGHVARTDLSAAGRVLAFLARMIGSPLPDTPGATGAAVVAVTEDASGESQVWTRAYARRGRFPQVVHSMKRFRGATGLEEYVGSGIGMALVLTEVDGALVFRSDHYFLELGRLRLPIPGSLAPGLMQITHRDLGDEFLFELSLDHPLLGRLIHQIAYFREV